MKKVLLIGSELGKGGAERSISLLSYYLEKDYDVTLCILSGTAREKYYKTCKKVVFIDPPGYTSKWGKLKAWKHRINKIKELKKGVDVSISFLEGPDYVNVITKKKEKIVLSIRGSKMFDIEIEGRWGQIRKKLLIPFLYKKADRIVCVTQALTEELHEYFGIREERLRTIYNFYERDEIITLSNEALTDEEAKIFSKPVIITSGRLHISKGYDRLIKILAELKKHTGARLMILGDGSLKDQFIDLSTSLGLKVCDWEKDNIYTDADVYMMGFQHNAFKFYRNSKAYALSSLYEGFPNVMAEALICHIPVVTTDCHTGPREMLNISGLDKAPITKALRLPVGSLLPRLNVINDNSIQEWVKEMQYWLQAPAPPGQAFEGLTDRFTLDAILQEWKDVIEN